METALVILAHPRSGSLNHALAERIVHVLREGGVVVRFHDLYAEGFDPLLRAAEAFTVADAATGIFTRGADHLLYQHRKELIEASILVVVHPNWWGKPPAIMAGWMDRVLVPGVAYELDVAGGVPTSLLSLRSIVVVNTSDTTAEREAELFGDPLDAIWRRCVAPYLGNPLVERHVLRVVADATPQLRAKWLADVGESVRRLVRHSPGVERSSPPS